MPPVQVWSYGNILEPGAGADFQKRFPGGSCLELSLEGGCVVFLPPMTITHMEHSSFFCLTEGGGTAPQVRGALFPASSPHPASESQDGV